MKWGGQKKLRVTERNGSLTAHHPGCHTDRISRVEKNDEKP